MVLIGDHICKEVQERAEVIRSKGPVNEEVIVNDEIDDLRVTDIPTQGKLSHNLKDEVIAM